MRMWGMHSTATTNPMATAPDFCQVVQVRVGVKNMSPNRQRAGFAP